MKLDIVGIVTAQHESEIETLCDFLERQKDRIQIILEIGTFQGGTAYIWSQVAGQKVITVDLSFEREGWIPVYRGKETKVPIIEIQGNSSAMETLEKVKAELSGELVDLLFIDGDHGCEACRADFFNYSPLVKDGGWIALHDIVHSPVGVPQAWNEIKKGHIFCEFIYQRQDLNKQRTSRNPGEYMGIGLLQWGKK